MSEFERQIRLGNYVAAIEAFERNPPRSQARKSYLLDLLRERLFAAPAGVVGAALIDKARALPLDAGTLRALEAIGPRPAAPRVGTVLASFTGSMPGSVACVWRLRIAFDGAERGSILEPDAFQATLRGIRAAKALVRGQIPFPTDAPSIVVADGPAPSEIVKIQGASIAAPACVLTLSELLGLPISPEVAVTGDVDERGAVGRVAGIESKVRACLRERYQVNRVVVPRACLDELPPELHPQIQCVSDVAELADAVLGPKWRETRLRPRAPSPWLKGEPFRRFRPFEREDERLFFGRDLAVRALVALVQSHRLVVVHGTSGAGKTSLLRAGLRPAIGELYHWLEIQPGEDVFAALGDALPGRPESVDTPEPIDLSRRLSDLQRQAGKPVLLVIDQAEELFAARSEERSRATSLRLAAVLCSMWRSAPGLHVVVSLRDDHHGQLRYVYEAGLDDIFAHGQRLPPLDRTGAQRALTDPLHLAGLTIDDELAERVVRDLTDAAGDISPVELAVVGDAVYHEARRQEKAGIEPAMYDSMGGAGKVVGTALRRVLQTLGGDRDTVRRVLEQMITSTGAAVPPLSRSELAARAGVPEPTVDRALQRLVASRLVRASSDAGERARYRIAHDQVALEVFDQLSDQQRHDLELREMLRLLMGRRNPTSYLRLRAIPSATRTALLSWRSRAVATPSSEERSFLDALARWQRASRMGRVIGAIMLALTATAATSAAVTYRARSLRADVQRADARAEAELARDPGMTMAWIAGAAAWLGGIAHEPEADFDRQWLLAREACEKGIGWPVAIHAQEVVELGFLPQAPPGASCPRCWPQRRLLASVSRDGDVRLLDLDRGGLAERLVPGHAAEGRSLAFSPDGRWLATAGEDGAVRVWDLDLGAVAPARELRVEAERRFLRVAFSPDGKRLAAGGHGNVVHLWDVSSWHAAALRSDLSFITRLSFSLDGRWLAWTGGSPGHMGAVLYDLRDGGEPRPLPGTLEAVTASFFAPDSRRLFVGGVRREGDRRDLFVLPVGEPALEPESSPLEGKILTMGLSPDGLRLAVGRDQGQIEVWDPHAWKLLCQLPPHRGPAGLVRFTPDGRQLLSAAYDDGDVRVSDVDGERLRRFPGPTPRIYAAAISPDAAWVAAGAVDGAVRLYAANDCAPVRLRGKALAAAIGRLAVGTNADWILGIAAKKANVWRDLAPVPVQLPFEGVERRSLSQPSPDRVVFVDAHGDLRGWDFAAGRELPSRTLGGPVYATLLRSDGGLLAASGEELVYLPAADGPSRRWRATVEALAGFADDGVLSIGEARGIRIWDLHDPSRSRILEAPEVLTAIAARADTALSAGRSGQLLRWDLTRGRYQPIALERPPPVTDIALSSDARVFAGGSQEGSVILGFSGTGETRVLLEPNGVTAVALSGNGRALVSGMYEGQILVHPLPPLSRDEFAAWLGRHLPWRGVPPNVEPAGFPGLSGRR